MKTAVNCSRTLFFLLALLVSSLALVAAAAPPVSEEDQGWEAQVPPEALERRGNLWLDLLKLKLFKSSAEERTLAYYQGLERNSANRKDRARATLIQAELQLQAEEYWEAYQTYRRALTNYASFVPFNAVLSREFDIALQHFEGRKGRLLFVKFSTNDKALEIYDHILEVGRYSPAAPKALYQSGMISFMEGKLDEAIEKFTRLVTDYPRSALAPNARIELSSALLLAAAEADGDGALAAKARRQLRQVAAADPSHERIETVDGRLQAADEIEARRLLALAEFYRRPAHLRDASSRRYLNSIVTKYAKTSSARKAETILASLPAEGAAPTPAPPPVAAPKRPRPRPAAAPAPARPALTRSSSSSVQVIVVPSTAAPITTPAPTAPVPKKAAAPKAPAPKSPTPKKVATPKEPAPPKTKSEKWLRPVEDLGK